MTSGSSSECIWRGLLSSLIFHRNLKSGMAEGDTHGSTAIQDDRCASPPCVVQWIRASCFVNDHDVVLGPTHDGGYYLLGLRTPEPRLFGDIDWSSGRELGQTRNRASQLGLRVKDVRRTFDIDNITDLLALQELIQANGADACPRTAAALAQLDRLSAPRVGTPVR